MNRVAVGNLINYLTMPHGGVGRTGIVQPVGNRHVFKNIIAEGHAKVHNGNKGVTSVGHDFGIIEVRGCAIVRNGMKLLWWTELKAPCVDSEDWEG